MDSGHREFPRIGYRVAIGRHGGMANARADSGRRGAGGDGMAALTITPAAVDDDRLAAWINKAADGFAHDVDRVQRDLEAGRSHGFFALDGGIVIGGMVLADDDGFLSVQAAAGIKGRDLMRDFMPLVEAASRECGGRGVRFETSRRGMVEILGRMGFETQFVTMAKVF